MVRPKLSVQAVLHLIRILGLSAGYVQGEYRVNFKGPIDHADTCYYTTDGEDALDTARIMARTIGTDGRIKELSNGLLIVASV
jgi:hypothetical protein